MNNFSCLKTYPDFLLVLFRLDSGCLIQEFTVISSILFCCFCYWFCLPFIVEAFLLSSATWTSLSFAVANTMDSTYWLVDVLQGEEISQYVAFGRGRDTLIFSVLKTFYFFLDLLIRELKTESIDFEDKVREVAEGQNNLHWDFHSWW